MEYRDFDNAMARQVKRVPELIRKLEPDLDQQIRQVLTTPEIYGIKKIILTGCGDCFAAAVAAARAFEQLLGLPVQVVSPLDLARYYQMRWVGETPGDPLVIAMSNSGSAKRLIEAAVRVRKHHSMVLAITANEHSALAKQADRVIKLNLPELEPSPGVCSYAAMLFCLYLLAIRLGEVRLKAAPDEISSYRRSLISLADYLDVNYDVFAGRAFALAKQHENCQGMEFYGAGYELGSALYGSQKAYEAVGLMGTYADTENWFHVQAFLKNHATVLTVVFADAGNEAYSRTREMAERLQQMKRDFVLVANDEHLTGSQTFTLPRVEAGFFLPLIQFAPAALITAFLAALTKEPYSRGFQGIWAENAQTYSPGNSEMIDVD